MRRGANFALATLAIMALTLSILLIERNNRDRWETLRIFDAAFAPESDAHDPNPWIRHRNGLEMFCLTAIKGGGAARELAESIIAEISVAGDLRFRTEVVEALAQCPGDRTAFFVLLGRHPGDAAIRAELTRLTGFAPPVEAGRFDGALGLSISLPGWDNREFIFVHADATGFHVPNMKSVLVEELLQLILKARYVPSDRIVSLLGESLRAESYENWFDHNPRGLCRIDLILLELFVGDSPPRFGDSTSCAPISQNTTAR